MFRTIFLCGIFFVIGALCGGFYSVGYITKNTEMEKFGLGFTVAMIVIAVLVILIIKGYEDRIKEHKEEDLARKLNKP